MVVVVVVLVVVVVVVVADGDHSGHGHGHGHVYDHDLLRLSRDYGYRFLLASRDLMRSWASRSDAESRLSLVARYFLNATRASS